MENQIQLLKNVLLLLNLLGYRKGFNSQNISACLIERQ